MLINKIKKKKNCFEIQEVSNLFEYFILYTVMNKLIDLFNVK